MVWHGDQYRLLSPYENPAAAIEYLSEDKNSAILFTYLHSNRFVINATERPIQLKGLDAAKKYVVKEINLYPGTKSTLEEGKIYSGDFLMNVGINPYVNNIRTSVIIEINEVVN